MTTIPLHLWRVIAMTLPFVGDGTTYLDGFSASVKRAKNAPADSAVYPLVYPFETTRRQNPLNTRAIPAGSNGAGAPNMK